ncbi:RIO-like kinase [Mycena venus]|uniref:RIO-like kinase n=1 Tax=Mycena venus TaxID=2733690 RepID=A0A8H6U3J5_9AGAR|nr:RIO-like kinase [Mycena venus]
MDATDAGLGTSFGLPAVLHVNRSELFTTASLNAATRKSYPPGYGGPDFSIRAGRHTAEPAKLPPLVMELRSASKVNPRDRCLTVTVIFRPRRHKTQQSLSNARNSRPPSPKLSGSIWPKTINITITKPAGGGWAFRDAEPAGLEEKARRLLCQCIDELIYYEVTHIILATQEQYVLLLLDGSHQFCISRVYTILGSSTQARDMVELVLFYAHALLTRRPPYPPSRPPSVSVYRVTVPEFSPRLFQPHEALLCNGRLIHRAKLAILPRIPGKPNPRPFSVQFHTSHASCRHEGDIVVSFGRLIFWLFDTHIVAKAAYQSSALDRLQHEFAVYEFLRALQGVVIPSLFGMYRNLSDGSSMLVTSYAGVTLKDFDTLYLKDRQTLLLRVVRLHQAGVLHNDLEPRNVVLSERSGPRIIDFDNATLDHTCARLSCKELCELAHCLGLDLGAELSRAELSRSTRSWLLIPSLCVLIFFILCMAIRWCVLVSK